MLVAVCLLAILLFAYMWMREAQLRQEARDREQVRRKLSAMESGADASGRSGLRGSPLTPRR